MTVRQEQDKKEPCNKSDLMRFIHILLEDKVVSRRIRFSWTSAESYQEIIISFHPLCFSLNACLTVQAIPMPLNVKSSTLSLFVSAGWYFGFEDSYCIKVVALKT